MLAGRFGLLAEVFTFRPCLADVLQQLGKAGRGLGQVLQELAFLHLAGLQQDQVGLEHHRMLVAGQLGEGRLQALLLLELLAPLQLAQQAGALLLSGGYFLPQGPQLLLVSVAFLRA